MLMLKAERIALLALDRRLAELQATSRTAFFAIASMWQSSAEEVTAEEVVK